MGRGITLHAARRTVSALFKCALVFAAVLFCSSIVGCAPAGDAEVSWLIGAPERQGSSYTVQLTEAQRGQATQATYTVYRRNGSAYDVLAWKVPANIDAEGRVTLPADPDVLALQAGEREGPIAVTAECLGASDDSIAYRVDNIRLVATPDLGPSNNMGGDDITYVTAVFHGDERAATEIEQKRLRPLASYPFGEVVTEDQMGAYHGLSYIFNGPYLKARADDGSLAPVTEWTTSSQTATTGFCDFDGDMQIVRAPASSFAGDFFVQLVVDDAEGRQHGSEMTKLDVSASAAIERFDVPTERGALTFERAGDSALLHAYEGEDDRVEIPPKAGGLPVTAIGDRAFADNEYVAEVVVPDTVTSIGHEAFRGSRIENFDLSSRVKRIGNAAFARTRYLERFTLQGQSAIVSVRDGVLYSTDGKRLIAYPSAKGSAYDVPDGVEEIAYAAFAGAHVERVKLPESLREIAPCAFAGCVSLAEAPLPESLERIGSYAFGRGESKTEQDGARSNPYATDAVMSAGKPPAKKKSGRAPINRIVVGKNVSYIGRDAFEGLELKTIEVDPANRWYRSNGGFLISTDGVLLQAPSGMVSPIVIPNGVRALAEESLAQIMPATESPSDLKLALVDVFIPPSVREIEDFAFSRTTRQSAINQWPNRVWSERIHAPEGSWAAKYAQENGIQCDSAQDADTFRMDRRMISTPTADLTFRMYGDHAELSHITVTEASGVTGHVEVPAQIDHVPVTKLGGDARDRAEGTVATLLIPPSVREIDARFLSHLYGLQAYDLSGESEWLSVRDGVLFNADGSTLLAYPRAYGGKDSLISTDRGSGFAFLADDLNDLISERDFLLYDEQGRLIYSVRVNGSSYTIPDGVRTIADYAFFGADVTEVHFTDGLERIGADAFAWCRKLEDVTFPRSLRHIGREAFYLSGVRSIHLNDGLEEVDALAFGATMGCKGLYIPKSVTTIGAQAFHCGSEAEDGSPGERTLRIGSGLERLGDVNPFANIEVEEFDVTLSNRHFKSEGPLLLSKDGRVLYACASSASGEVLIPEGVERIERGALHGATNVTDVYVPDSVVHIEDSAFSSTNPSLTLHCSPTSETALFAKCYGIACEQ